VTFDCYGTLIDWESGIRAAALPLLAHAPAAVSPAAFFERWEQLQFERLRPYRPYRQVLRESVRAALAELGVAPTQRAADTLGDAMGDWEPFADTCPALEALRGRVRFGVITNTDDAIIASTRRRLGVPLDFAFTAEQAPECRRCGSTAP
jgi:2-haloacid dehalogenase